MHLWSSIFWALLVPITAGSRTAVKVEAGPPQAPSFNPEGRDKLDHTRSTFEEHEKRIGAGYNQHIPARTKEGLRIATWNTHMLLDLSASKPVVSAFIGDVKSLHADVLLLQEVPLSGEERLQDFEEGLAQLGYQHRVTRYSTEDGTTLGMMVASRHPIQSLEHFELGFKRILVDASIDMDGMTLHVLGTHLHVDSPHARRDQASFIADHLLRRGNYDGAFVLAGDFNSPWTGPELAPIREAGHTEAFRGAGWSHPAYTCWSGAEVDFIFVGQQVKQRFSGAYVYHSPTSDHLPLLLDIKSEKEFTLAVALNDDSGVAWLLTVVIILVVVYALALRFLPRTSWSNAYRALRHFDSM